MSMKSDIDEVLAKADQLIAALSQQYEAAKLAGAPTGVSKVDVKIALEQLRSALDYLAVDINAVLYGGKNVVRAGRRIYFNNTVRLAVHALPTAALTRTRSHAMPLSTFGNVSGPTSKSSSRRPLPMSTDAPVAL